MNSFTMTGKEASVLFGLMSDSIDLSGLPIGSKNLLEIHKEEAEEIAEDFANAGLIDGTADHFRPARELDRFLKPIATAKAVMIFNHGREGRCDFNASLYFAKSGVTALLDQKKDIKVIALDSAEDVMFFLPELTAGGERGVGGVPYNSYLLYRNDRASVHVAKLDPATGRVWIEEGTRGTAKDPVSAERYVSAEEYQSRLNDAVKEVWDASCR